MRLHTPVPFITRELTEPMEFDGCTAPAGTDICILLYNAHHNPLVWPNSMVSQDVDVFIDWLIGAYRQFLQYFSYIMVLDVFSTVPKLLYIYINCFAFFFNQKLNTIEPVSIRHTKGPGKCVGLYRMSEYLGFILVNRNSLGS